MNRFCQVIAFTPFCEDDAWLLPQYLNEMERLGINFVVHFDRCSAATKLQVLNHHLCIGYRSQDNLHLEYTEQHKQKIFDLVTSLNRYKWALHWDIDEVWEKAAPDKLDALLFSEADYLRVAWVNTWGDMQHIRIDPPNFQGIRRVKLYNISEGRKWKFDHAVTYGCKLMDTNGNCPDDNAAIGETSLVCLHTGLMTRELRLKHKERWDRVYGTAIGRNPYQFWDYCLDEVAHPPTIIKNPYL